MSKFNEATRVQMPAMVHLTRLGYSYFGKINEEMAGIAYDPDTNILTDVFKQQFEHLTPSAKGEFEETLRAIRQELANDVSYNDIKEKGYSLSAGQYFDIKIDYVDITEDEFNRRMDNFKTTLRQQFNESHRLEEEILKQLDCIGFNENVGKENSNE